MPDVALSVEKYLEAATLQLLGAYSLVTTITTRIYRRRDVSVAYTPPLVWVGMVGAPEYGLHTGWYRGPLQLGCRTYRDDDKAFTICETLAGAVRAWAQQADLVAQYAGTATATAGNLAVKHVAAADSFDNSADRWNEIVISVDVLARASSAA